MNRRPVIAAVVLSFAITSIALASPATAIRAGWTALATTLSRHRAAEHPGNNAPVAVADSYRVVRGQTLTVNSSAGVLANDSAPAGKTLTAAVVSNPSHGTLTLSADGGFTYVNDGSSAPSDSFTYRASDGPDASAPATVTIAITDTTPVAAADAFSTTQGQTLLVPAPGVLANDTVNGAVIASYGPATGTEQTSIGADMATEKGQTFNLKSDGSFFYAPAPNFVGTDSVKYVLTNSSGSSTATVTFTVTATVPVATGDSYTAPGGAAFSVPAPGVFANDTLNGATLASYGVNGNEQSSIGSATATSGGGSVVVNATGGFTYTPASGFSGNDTFRYTLRNSAGNSTATVTIAVQATVSTPTSISVASPGFFFTFSGTNGQNPVLTLKQGQTYKFVVNTSSIHPFEILDAPAGSVTNNNISNGTITFVVPNGPGTYRYICPIHGFGNSITTTP